MKSLKKLVRAISPFHTRKRQENNNNNDNSNINDQFQSRNSDGFDLRGVDVHRVLHVFFNKYNPNEIWRIDEMLKLYPGDESELLTELYEKHEVSRVDMQWCINESRYNIDDTNDDIRYNNGSLDAEDPDCEEHLAGAAAEYTWDIENVDMKQAVKLFYQKYNPAKISEIDEILDPYEGDEIVMLRILCNKYDVSQEIMQQFLDRATQVSNPFIFHHKDSSNNSNASIDSDDIEVDWNLKDVHVPTVVNSFYKAYCPGKTPRQSEIEKVPASESASFLLQLCYNFNVHPEQMYPLIEAARRNGPALPSPAKTSSLAANEFNSRGRSNSYQRNLRHTNGDDASSTGSIANSLSSTVRHRAPPPPPPPPLMTTQLNPAGSKAPVPVANFIEVPQTVFNPSRRPSLKLGDGDSDNNSQRMGGSHAAKAAETLQLASPPRNNSGGVMEKKAAITVDSIEESELDSGSSSLRQAASDLAGKGSHPRKPSTLKVKLHGGEGDEPTVTQVFSEASTEIEKMKSELEITRQQLKEVCMESQAVLKILKDNSTELERSKSAGRRSSELPPPALKPDGALTGDASNETLRQQMEDMNAEYYKKCDLLVAQNDLLQKRNEELSVALHSARTTLDAALSDRRDLLELIDVVSSAASNGINFNTILEAYLTKLGLSTADLNSPGKANGNYSGPKKTIGNKISDALEWKRAQMRNTILSKTSTAEDIRLPSPSLSRPQQLYEQSQGDGNDDESEEVKNPYDAASEERGGFAKKSVSNGFLVSEGSSSKVGGELYGRPPQQADDSTNDRIDMQYDLARKAHLHAVSHAKLAAQLATQNLTATQKGINAEKLGGKSSDTRTPRTFSPAPRKMASNENLQQSSSKLVNTSSELHYRQQLVRHQQTPEEMVTDWKECFDPRTNRKYYYSPSLKKSMWNDPTKPGSRNGTPKAASSSRYKSPNVTGGDHSNSNSNSNSNRSTAGKAGALTRSNSSDFLTRSNNSSRNTSPALSTTALSTTALSTSPKRADSSAANNGDVWVMALDAKSNRYYWYNRQTKVSTWRKPAVP